MESKVKITPFTQYIIDQVRIRRLEIELSQRDLSLEISNSESLVGNVENENDSHKYTGSQMELIAATVKCTVDDLFPDEILSDDTLQPKTKVVILKGMGPMAMLNSLLENGDFKDAKSLNEITALCNQNPNILPRKTTDFSSTISRLLDQKKLIKIQVPGEDGVKYRQH